MTETEGQLIGRSPPTGQGVPASVADYEVQQVLGHGDSGRVYLACPPNRLERAEQFVAVKQFNGPCLDSAYDRAVEELRAVSALRSPYLPRVSRLAWLGALSSTRWITSCSVHWPRLGGG